MKVVVTMTLDANPWVRRAIRHHFGEDGLASRAEVVRWYQHHGRAMDMDLDSDLANAIKRGEVEKNEPWRRVR